MTIASAIFAATYAALPDYHAVMRIDGRVVIPQCLVVGMGGERVATDEGIAMSPDVTLRVLTDSLPTGKAMAGDVVEVRRESETAWRRYKIGTRVESAGMVRLQMEDVAHAR